MNRIYTFDKVAGHAWLVNYLKTQIAENTLKHFIIIEGQEGLGKTTIADLIALNLVYGLDDSEEKREAYNTVVCKKTSNDYIKKFELSVNGGKDVAKEVRDEMHATFTLNRNKVIICDECHNLSDAAQDVFLSDTEYTSDKVYLIMLTTNVERLKPSLRSRAIPIHMNPLKQSDMVKLLITAVNERHLTIQNQEVALRMLAEWSEFKPRIALNILEAFAPGSTVSLTDLRNLVGYLDIKDIIPLLSNLSGSLVGGLNYINEISLSNAIVPIVIECIKIKEGESSYKMKIEDLVYVREQLRNVSTEQLSKFLIGITNQPNVTKLALINAFVSAHYNNQEIVKENTTDALEIEKQQIARITPELASNSIRMQAPSLNDLIRDGDIVED